MTTSAVVADETGEADVVGDRHHLVIIGLGAVWVACLIFAGLRLAVAIRTGKLTPWWGNAAGLLAITALYAWYRRSPRARSSSTAHGTALVAMLALLIPVAYGMDSTIWWLSLVGFAMVLLGRRREARVWGVVIPLVIVVAVLAEPYVQIAGAAGEPFVESALARIVFVLILVGMAAAFRHVAEQRAAALHAVQAELRSLKNQFEARALTGEDLAARRLERLAHLNSVLRAIRNVNQLIVHESDPARLVQETCDTLVEARGYPSAWIRLVDGDDSSRVVGLAGWACDQEFALGAKRGDPSPCTGQVVSDDRSVTLIDPETCRGCPLRRHYRNHVAARVTLRHGSRTFGLLGVAVPEETAADREEISLLEEIAGDLGFALHSVEAGIARRHSEELFRVSFNQAAVGQALTSLDGRFLKVNSAMARLLGRSAEELVGEEFNSITHPEDRAVGQDAFGSLRQGASPVHFAKRYLNKHGDTVWVDVSVAAVKGADDVPTHFMVTMFDITSAKRAEEAIRKLARFPADNPAPVLRLGVDGTLLYANSAASVVLQALGASEAAVAPGPFSDAVTAAIATGAVRTFELAVAGREFEFLAAPVPEDQYVNFYGSDITHRKQAENALQRQKTFAESLIGTAQAIVLVLDLEGKIVLFNEYMETMTGFGLDQVRGKDWFDTFLPARVRDRARRLFGQALGGMPTRGNIYPMLTRDGRELMVEWYDKTMFDEHGASGLLCVGQDVTSRHEAEAELRFQRMLLEAQGQASLDGILHVDGDGRIVWFNRRFVELWGIPQAAVETRSRRVALGAVLEKLVDPEAFEAKVDQLYAQPTVKSRDEIQLKDGRIFDRYSSPVIGDDGTLLGRVWLFRDVTDVRKLQASLAQSDRLTSIGLLAAGVAHEINNPLSYVLYNLESLSQDLPGLTAHMLRCHTELIDRIGHDAAARVLGGGQQMFTPADVDDLLERLRDARSGCEQIKTIARSLGTFSRVEQTDLVPVNLQRAIEHAITMSFNEIKYRARLVKDFGQIAPVLASDGRLAQVFLNLLINAAHAIDEGHVEDNQIRVRTFTEDDQACVEISDTGRGIPPELLDRIFDPFFSTKGVGVGSGLGLSICKNIVTGFGGEIDVTSVVGEGTRFVIRLPRMPAAWQPEGAAERLRKSTAPVVRGRILVIDDEAAIRAALVRLLRGAHEVVTACSGQEGLELLARDRRFDLVFCDLMMPEMSGMELHARLAEKDPGLAEQVVFITGGVFTPGATEYLAKVGNLRVEKPFDTATLKKMADELVRAARSRAAQS